MLDYRSKPRWTMVNLNLNRTNPLYRPLDAQKVPTRPYFMPVQFKLWWRGQTFYSKNRPTWPLPPLAKRDWTQIYWTLLALVGKLPPLPCATNFPGGRGRNISTVFMSGRPLKLKHVFFSWNPISRHRFNTKAAIFSKIFLVF